MARVVKSRTEPRCIICASSNREQIDAYIARRGEMVDGELMTWERLARYVVPILLDGKQLSTSALKRHFGTERHSRLVSEEVTDAAPAEGEGGEPDGDPADVLGQIDALLAGGEFISPTGLLHVQLRAYLLELRRKLAAGERVQPLTHDQAARAANHLVAAERSGVENQLLGALGAAIGASAVRSLSAPPAQIEAGEEIVVEAEAVEDE